MDFFGTPLVIEPSAGQLSGDAGLLPLRQFDERIGLTRSFACTLDDPRDAELPARGRGAPRADLRRVRRTRGG